MLWVLKRTVSLRHFFEHPKQMFRLMSKYLITILHLLILTYVCLSGPMHDSPDSLDFVLAVRQWRQLKKNFNWDDEIDDIMTRTLTILICDTCTFYVLYFFQHFSDTVLPAKTDSIFMFCLQSYQGLIIDRSLVY